MHLLPLARMCICWEMQPAPRMLRNGRKNGCKPSPGAPTYFAGTSGLWLGFKVATGVGAPGQSCDWHTAFRCPRAQTSRSGVWSQAFPPGCPTTWPRATSAQAPVQTALGQASWGLRAVLGLRGGNLCSRSSGACNHALPFPLDPAVGRRLAPTCLLLASRVRCHVPMGAGQSVPMSRVMADNAKYA